MSTPTTSPGSADEIHRMLLRWQSEGLLDPTEVERIEAAEAARAAAASLAAPGAGAQPALPTAPVRPAGSLIGEALGYAGGALMIAATAVLVGRSWERLLFGTQVALTAAAALLLLVAGLLVPQRMGGPGARLRAVLWAASAGMGFGMWMLVFGDDGFAWADRERLLVGGALACGQAAVLWWRSRHVLLHLATFAMLAVMVAGAGQYLTFLHDKGTAVGLTLCVFGAAWVLLGARHVVHPAMAAYLVGSLLAVIGAQATTSLRWGTVLALVTAAAVIAFAVWRRSLAVLAVGTYGLLAAVIASAEKFFPGSAGAALGLLVAGTVLVASALWITRHNAAKP